MPECGTQKLLPEQVSSTIDEATGIGCRDKVQRNAEGIH